MKNLFLNEHCNTLARLVVKKISGDGICSQMAIVKRRKVCHVKIGIESKVFPVEI